MEQQRPYQQELSLEQSEGEILQENQRYLQFRYDQLRVKNKKDKTAEMLHEERMSFLAVGFAELLVKLQQKKEKRK